MEKDRAERLSFTSERFDPNLALMSVKAVPTPLKSKIFSNLNKYIDSLHQSASFKSLGWLPKGIVEESVNRSAEIAQLKKKSEFKEDGSGASRIQKLQKLIANDIKEEVIKRPRHRPNVMQRMEGLKNGPFSILYNCMSKGLKMKVWTRRCAGLRGACTGYLVAFDKHMNLAMIDVDEVYALEVCTLSIEKQHQIQKEKRARKRCRNRLTRINGFIRTNDSESQRRFESEGTGDLAIRELLQEKDQVNLSPSNPIQRSALYNDDYVASRKQGSWQFLPGRYTHSMDSVASNVKHLIQICHFGNFMNIARKKVRERAEDLTESTCAFKEKPCNVIRDNCCKGYIIVSNENQDSAPCSSPLTDKADLSHGTEKSSESLDFTLDESHRMKLKHNSSNPIFKAPKLVQDSDISESSEKRHVYPPINKENEPHLLIEPQSSFGDHDSEKKPGRTLNSPAYKDSQSINPGVGQSGSFVDDMCGVLAERGKTCSISKKPNEIRDFRNRRSHVFQRRHINQLFIRGDNIALISYEP